MIRHTGRYGLSFLLALIAGLFGAVISLKAIKPPDFSQLARTDPEGGINFISTVLAQAAPATPAARGVTPTPRPTPTSASALVIPTPVPPTPTPTPIPTQPSTPNARVSQQPTPTPPPSPTPTPEPPEETYEFVLAAPVRHTTEGCVGQAIRGTVYDANGNPLPGVRLWMYDQWANEAYAESKSGAIDLGQYDFPIFHNSPTTFYITVLGPDGAPISPTVEVYHRQGPFQAANCHWVDWKRTR